MLSVFGSYSKSQILKLYLSAFFTMSTIVCVLFINLSSLIGYAYYFVLLAGFTKFVERSSLSDCLLAFIFNSFLIGLYYSVQVNVYPESYGTTSPLGSWTDDSYFFALVADQIPANLDVRVGYEEYEHPYTSLIRLLTPFKITHPMDVIFFQSAIMAWMATFAKRLMIQETCNKQSAIYVYFLILTCPLLLMNGGVVFLRDTFVAAALVYSLYCINDAKYLKATIVFLLMTAIRPGTSIILLIVYLIIYKNEIKLRLTRTVMFLMTIAVTSIFLLFYFVDPDSLNYLLQYTSATTVDLEGREVYDDVAKNSSSIYVYILNLPYSLKLVFGGAYFFIYPFFNPAIFFNTSFFDFRTFVLVIAAPIYYVFTNAYFFSAALESSSVFKKKNLYLLSIIVVYVLLGTYSLQTRHKSIVQPLYFMLVAYGISFSSNNTKIFGWFAAIAIMSFEILYFLLSYS